MAREEGTRPVRNDGSTFDVNVKNTVDTDETKDIEITTQTIDTSNYANNPFDVAINLPANDYYQITVHISNSSSSAGDQDAKLIAQPTANSNSSFVIHKNDGTSETLSAGGEGGSVSIATRYAYDDDDLILRLDDLGNNNQIEVKTIAEY